MSRSFTKLFSSITESTVWTEPAATRLAWITMLAMADRRGRVWASIPGLANRARVTVEETETALARFLAPDQYSRTPDHEGRRIEIIDGGWRLLNYEKYRALRDEESIRESKREHMRRVRKSGKDVPQWNTVEPSRSRSRGIGKAKAPSAGLAPADTGFDQVWNTLPKRAGNNPRARAARAFRARLAAGSTVQEMQAGAERYARWCAATGKAGSEFVMQAASFLGPEKPFLQAWVVAAGATAWWATTDSILAKAQELGISTRGETADALKAAIRERMGQRA